MTTEQAIEKLKELKLLKKQIVGTKKVEVRNDFYSLSREEQREFKRLLNVKVLGL